MRAEGGSKEGRPQRRGNGRLFSGERSKKSSDFVDGGIGNDIAYCGPNDLSLRRIEYVIWILPLKKRTLRLPPKVRFLRRYGDLRPREVSVLGVMRDAARALLQANTETVEFEGRVWRYSVPSTCSYPHQWLWDSSFHAVIWSLFDPARGCDELRSLFRWQWPNGFIPHVVFWHPERVNQRNWHYLESADIWSFLPHRRPRTTALTQPPVLATAVERLVLAGAEDFLSEALPVLERYYRYLASERDPDQDGLISTIVQFETGLDFSPAYDSALGAGPRAARKILVKSRLIEIKNKFAGYDLTRIFARNDHAEDVLVNTIWIENLKVLARLARRAEQSELATWAEAKATQALQSLLERAWDPGRGLFFNLVGSAEMRPEAKTIQCLLPLLLEDLPTDVAERLLAHLTDPHEFWSPYPVPSVALDEPSYTDDSYIRGLRLIWRGPCSMNTNWFLYQGLLRHGETGYASQLAQRSRELVESGDFNEFYDARSGRPVGAHRFGWATLVADFRPLPAESPPASLA